MQRTKTADGRRLLKLEVGEKYPSDAKDFDVIIGKEKDGNWYRYKPSANNKPVDPATGYELRRRTQLNKTTSKATDRHQTELAKFTEKEDRARHAARKAARKPTKTGAKTTTRRG